MLILEIYKPKLKTKQKTKQKNNYSRNIRDVLRLKKKKIQELKIFKKTLNESPQFTLRKRCGNLNSMSSAYA